MPSWKNILAAVFVLNSARLADRRGDSVETRRFIDAARVILDIPLPPTRIDVDATDMHGENAYVARENPAITPAKPGQTPAKALGTAARTRS